MLVDDIQIYLKKLLLIDVKKTFNNIINSKNSEIVKYNQKFYDNNNPLIPYSLVYVGNETRNYYLVKSVNGVHADCVNERFRDFSSLNVSRTKLWEHFKPADIGEVENFIDSIFDYNYFRSINLYLRIIENILI